MIMSVIAARGPRGHVALMALEDVLCTATERREREREKDRDSDRARRREQQSSEIVDKSLLFAQLVHSSLFFPLSFKPSFMYT